MKQTFLSLLIVFFGFNGFAQSDYKRIKIADDIELMQISDNAYIHVSSANLGNFGLVYSNGLLLVNNREAFLFDTPADDDQTERLVNGIKDFLQVEIIGFVASHWHNDCMGGLNYLHLNGIPSYANQMTIEFAGEHNLPLPQNGFNDSLSLKLNNIDIFCYYPGAGHSLDNIVIWIPSEKILFGGCLIKDMQATGLGNTADGDVEAWPHSIKNVIDRFPGAEIVIPGHGQTGGKELLLYTQKLVSK